MDEHLSGYLQPLKHVIQAPISYELVTNQGSLSVNEYLGTEVTIAATGKKSCVHCGRAVRKLYQNGYCFPCVTSLAECDLCIVKPHECHYDAGTCRDESFAQSHCMIPHYVYLAYSSSVKVGLTRKGRQMIRWVDQGASAAILLAELPTRKAAGELEMEVAHFLPDKTDWRKMLQMTVGTTDVDMQSVKDEVIQKICAERQQFLLQDEHTIHSFSYPRLDGYPVKLTSWSLDKLDKVSGTLIGIKGQYLLFKEGVLNVRKHAGYEVQISVS